MRKKFFSFCISLMLIFLVCFPLSACYTPTLKMSADFIQGWYCQDWTVENWDAKITELKNDGFEEIIFQSSISIENNSVDCYYNSPYFANLVDYECSVSPVLDNLLLSAKQNNFKVILGLTSTDSWWDNTNFANTEYCTNLANFDAIAFDEIMSLFYENYSDTITGIYWAYEIYTQNQGFELAWANIFNTVINHIDNSIYNMPICFSPFFSKYFACNNTQSATMWKNFFSNTSLRNIDTIYPQDGFGGYSGIFSQSTANALVEKMQILYNACSQYSQCNFGINIEIFTNTSTVAEFSRVFEQIKQASRFTNKLICFSFSHFADTHFTEDYQNYISTLP